jgi:serine phosphatase RsbU (regulator of sigma subunit)
LHKGINREIIRADGGGSMDRDAQLLKEKALLLLSRERELLSLRRTHARVSAWLTVAHSLSELVSLGTSTEETYTALAQKLMSLLELQKVRFYHLTRRETLRPIVRTGAAGEGERPLQGAAVELLQRQADGLCNELTTPGLEALSQAVDLTRFMWCRLADPENDLPVLMVAGYDAEKSAFYSPFEEEDFGHFRSMGEHLALQLRNATLIKQLEREKRSLQELNETLEKRVADRTEEIAHANRELGEALGILEEKDRRLNEDLDQARSFQQSILPLTPVSAQIDFGAIYRPLEQVGGDIYDITALGEGHFRVFVADATGHGVQASLRTIVLKSEYDRLKGRHADPDKLIIEFNRRLVKQFNPAEMLCTACCFDVIVTTGGARLRYVNAAHPPLLLASGGVTHEIYRDGPFLGLSEEIELTMLEQELKVGDTVLAYTDGLSDQLGGNRGGFRVDEAVREALRTTPALPQALEGVVARFDQFRGATAAADDLTLIGVRVRAQSAQPLP